MQPDHLDREIDANYDFFRRNLAELLRDQPRRFVLLKNQSIVAFFDTVTEAARHGKENYPDGLFSVQEVMEEPIDLGFFSHAGR